jgi:hypothetical protein
MGDEVRCTARLGRQRGEGRAFLETDDVVFRGDFRVKVPLRSISSVEARDGMLRITWPEGTLALELGPRAARWAERIRSPRSLLDKLGIKAEHKVSVVNLTDPEFVAQLEARAASVRQGKVAKGSDIVFYGASTATALDELPALAASIARDGAIWVIRPKGGKDITEAKVMAAGKAAGLVDVKVVRFSETHTAEKLVVPLAAR